MIGIGKTRLIMMIVMAVVILGEGNTRKMLTMGEVFTESIKLMKPILGFDFSAIAPFELYFGALECQRKVLVPI